MVEAKDIGKRFSVAICAVLFASTMVLSAVGPARASSETGQPIMAAPSSSQAVRYLA